jgi:hypothetical protein
MDGPDQRLFEDDLLLADFRAGVLNGFWDLAGADVLPDSPAWPHRVFWLAAGARANAPDRYYIKLDLAGYRSVPPTGTFWDPATKALLDFSKRPKGKQDSRCARIFRTDWENGLAFYHPYDRVAARGHAQWAREQPHRVWTSNHTIVDYLAEFHSLLNCGDYVGI